MWLTGELRANGSTSVGSISGSAGIGKTFLLDHALRETNLADRRYVTLRVAATSLLPTLAGIVMDLAASAALHSPKENDFPRITECRRALEWMDGKARDEIERAAATDSDLAKAVAEVYSLSRGLVQFVQHPVAQIAAKLAATVDPKHVERFVRLVQKAAAYQTEKAPRLRGRGDARLRNHLRSELDKTLAEALISDLERALIVGGPFTLNKESKQGRLLLIIDDYERLGEVAGEFLLRHLVPLLAAARFESLVLALGRDRLIDTHPGWRQHQQQHLLGDIALTELSHAEAEEYVRGRGISDASKIERIVTDTTGYPYLLESEVDDELHGQSSALSRELFVERTTQWMSPQQRQWATRLAFLDEISLETIPRVLNDDAEAVLAWFKRESSLRAPATDRWTMRPMIRTKLREYVRNDSPAKYGELITAAKGGDG